MEIPKRPVVVTIGSSNLVHEGEMSTIFAEPRRRGLIHQETEEIVGALAHRFIGPIVHDHQNVMHVPPADQKLPDVVEAEFVAAFLDQIILSQGFRPVGRGNRGTVDVSPRSEEHTSELPSLMCISYSVFCL